MTNRLDEHILELERKVLGDRTDIDAQQQLRTAYERAGRVFLAEYVEGPTYGMALEKLREKSQQERYAIGARICVNPYIVREGQIFESPFTVEEIAGIRLESEGFSASQESATPIAYSFEDPNKFKIQPKSMRELILLPKDCILRLTDYNNLHGFEGWVELDKTKGIYDRMLTQKEALEHPAWKAAIPDEKIRNAYIHSLYHLGLEKNMGFYLRTDMEGEIGILSLSGRKDGSTASTKSLDSPARFFRTAQQLA